MNPSTTATADIANFCGIDLLTEIATTALALFQRSTLYHSAVSAVVD